MKRIVTPARPQWRDTIRSQGLVYSETELADGTVIDYWNETAAYEFTSDEVLHLEDVVEDLHRKSVEAGRFLAEEQKDPSSPFSRLGIPRAAAEYAAYSLERGDLDLYGRFDLVYEGPHAPAKMLEYNADTPTGLVEASIVQWYWMQELFGDLDQWNGLHESLIQRWSQIRAARPGDGPLYFAHTELDESGEDILTTAYLRDCADAAGWDTGAMTMTEIGLTQDGTFVDMDDAPISSIFKLYPWEDMVSEGFGEVMCQVKPEGWYEPAWKMLLSTKMLSAAMWHLWPGHENLLATYVDGPRDLTDYVKKPLHGREGDNIEIVAPNYPGASTVQGGRYGDEGYVYQDFSPLPDFRGADGSHNHAVLGAWVIGGESRGVGIRESDGYVTDYFCRFVPNLIRG